MRKNIDPPYNTGSDWIYNDKVDDPRIRRWLGEVVGTENEDLTRHDKWLCMMYPRLRLLQKLLSEDGVLFISIGDDELANLIYLIKEIFGNPNSIFVWRSRSKPTNAGNAKYRPQKVSEYVVMYSRDKDRVFNIGEKIDEYSYPYEDEDGKYRTSTILTSNYGTYQRETMRFEIAGYTPPADKRWKAGKDIIQGMWDDNKLLFTSDGYPMEKVYEEENKTILTPLYTLISSEESGTAENGKSTLNNIIGSGHGFDTVKPVGLIQYLISISTKPDSIILDSFAGSGTTAQAVLDLNQHDGGNRKFILIELMDYANTITAERVKRVISGYEGKSKQEDILFSEKLNMTQLRKGEELVEEANQVREENLENYDTVSRPTVKDDCLQVIGTKENKEFVPGIGGTFSYYELGDPILIENELNENVGLNKIREYIYFTETRQQLPEQKETEIELLGKHIDTAYYFYYDANSVTTLSREWLQNIKTTAESYVIYADLCTLSDRELGTFHITFKKIPRDITKL